MALYIISIILLVLLSSFFSCVETAFSKASEIRIKAAMEKGSKKARQALWIIENFDKVLTAILIGNNIVNLGCSSLVTFLFTKLYGSIGPALATGAVTLAILTFGEIIPKCIGIEKCDQISLSVAHILKIFTYALYPLVILFSGIKTLFLKIMNVKNDAPTVTEDELKYIVESIEEEGILEEEESDMVQSALEFDEKTAQEILTPRVDVVAIDIEDSIEDITKLMLEERYTRVPVYEKKIDNVIGILHAKDFLEKLVLHENADIRSIMTPPHFIYKSMKLSSILNRFKTERFHIAIVTDEYGGMLGIVTMEDLLEEIVGDIWDEDDEIERECVKLKNGSFLVSGDMSLEDLFDKLDYKPHEEFKSNSVGGFIVEQLGEIPKRDQKIKYDSLIIEVKRIKNNRILSAIVKN